MQYADVIIDHKSSHTDHLFTYAAAEGTVRPGSRVYVPFTRGNRIYPAYVFAVCDDIGPERKKGLKQIHHIDEEISLPEEAAAISAWMKQEYFCKYIDGIRCFMPSGSASKRGKERKPYKEETVERDAPRELTVQQKMAMDRILPAIRGRERRSFLIHGVTSSGKTELYLQSAAACLEEGRSVIMLVPEISLTTQTVQRFYARFGREQVAVLHSRLSLGERYDEWVRARKGQVRIVIGARSALFAPLPDIGLIIMDEEHESSYKSDMTPRYAAAAVAEKRAEANGAVLLLGSATPSMESMEKVRRGQLEELILSERYNKTPLPAVSVVDMRQELRDGNRSIFSRSLYQKMETQLAKGQQVILFLNRRGYAGFLSCRSCGYVLKCPECGIAMTYHKGMSAALCHYCGRKAAAPEHCPECGSSYIRYFGTGTERVEEEVKKLFPDVTAERMDLDTTQKKGSGDAMLKRFKKGKTRILIGTQLVAKGLDFNNVGLVGIISADVSLNIPDFRSAERSFQLITQAAGRAGRGDEPGQVVIQTYSPDHYAVRCAAEKDEAGFYSQEARVRKILGYPPFSDLIQLVVATEEEQEAAEAMEKIRDALLRWLGPESRRYMLGPRPAPLNKAAGRYRQQLLIKCPPEEKERIWKALHRLQEKVLAEKDGLWLLTADVNPYSLL